MHLATNTLLQGRYRVQALVAQGGMGAVYRAIDERLGNTVALKQSLVSDPRLREAFEREARLLASLQHPALPVVSDHFAEDNSEFLVMQYIGGDDLATLLKGRASPFTLAEVLPWADRLLDALDYLHSQPPPIIHRDIKPQNLKLSARGEIILLDFGLAKGQPGGMTSGAQSVLGYTPHYAPLEQIQGAGTDPRSDLYSFAATFYQLLSGEAPPDALTRAAAAVNGQVDPLRPLDMLNPRLPKDLARLLQSAMAQRPDERPASARALRQALHAAVQSAHGFGRSASRAADRPQPAPGSDPAFSSAGMTTIVQAPTRGARGGIGWIAGLALLLVALSALATWRFVTISSGAGASLAVGTAAPSSSAPFPTSISPTVAAVALGSSRATPLERGAVVNLPGWQLEVLETLRGEEAWRRIYKANQFNDPAPEGYEYLLVRMRIATNFPDGEKRQIYPLVTGDRMVEYKAPATVPPEPALETELSGGRQSMGWDAFLVAVGEADLLLEVDELTGPYEGPPVYIALEQGAAISADPSLESIDPNNAGRDHREPAAIGEMAVSEDWEITVQRVLRGAPALDALRKAYELVKEPPPGHEYALAYVAVRYIGDGGLGPETESVGHNNFRSTAVTVADPEAEQIDPPAVYILPAPELDANLYPGGRAEGWVVIELPVDNPQMAMVFTTGSDSNHLNTRYFALK